MSWDWSRFVGSETALKFNRRDLPALEALIDRVSDRRVVVQAGGHLGIFPKRLAECFGVVYTFEPAADLFAALMTNAPETNIYRFQAALGVTRGPVGLARSRRYGTGPVHEGLTHIAGSGSVPVMRIDDLALPVCDLIALDVEGYELQALQGASATLLRCRPLVSVEVNRAIRAAATGDTPEDLRTWLQAMGYRQVAQQQSDEVYAVAA